MIEIGKVELHYDKWRLKSDSLIPGWEIVINFMKTMVEAPYQIIGWRFKFNSKMSYYDCVDSFNNNNRNEIISNIESSMRSDAIWMLKLPKGASSDLLFNNYTRISKGVIKDNRKSDIFVEPIELGDWTMIEKEEEIFVIYHDGDPLVLLGRR